MPFASRESASKRPSGADVPMDGGGCMLHLRVFLVPGD